MAKNQRTPEQRWHEIDFSNRLTDTSLWIRMADELVDAANILEAEVIKYWSEIQLDEHNHPVSASGRKYVQGEYSLLIAYALENYFKALLIHRNQKDLKGRLLTKLPGYLHTHDLGELASKLKFKLDTSEEELLCRLSRSSIWAARYPIPIGPEALANMEKLSNGQSYLVAYSAPQDIKRVHNFIDRLRNHVLAEIANNA
jgi:HEPN domain-containing protein